MLAGNGFNLVCREIGISLNTFNAGVLRDWGNDEFQAKRFAERD